MARAKRWRCENTQANDNHPKFPNFESNKLATRPELEISPLIQLRAFFWRCRFRFLAVPIPADKMGPAGTRRIDYLAKYRGKKPIKVLQR
jgi:hypothetical protein